MRRITEDVRSAEVPSDLPVARLLVPAGIVVAACLIGAWIFRREAPRIAENL